MLHRNVRIAPSLALIVLLSACLVPTALAQTSTAYAAAREVAAACRLEFVDLSQGDLHACKLVGNDHEVMLFAGLDNILINDTSHNLTRPVRWSGRDLLLPREAVDLIAARLGARADVPYETVQAKPAAPSPARKLKVVIDPGHGGGDPGAVYGGVKEKDVNLDISKRLARMLEAKGIEVVLTRNRDVAVDLDRRVAIAKRARPDLFVSIHANAETSGSAKGAMTLYPPRGARGAKPDLYGRADREVLERTLGPDRFGARGPVGRKAFQMVARTAFESYRWMSVEAAHEIQRDLARVTGVHSRHNGVIEDWRGLRVLSTQHAPAVLVEVDFLSNADRRRRLAQSSYRNQIAESLSRSIVRFLEKSD